ncbi:multisubunit Na+/H+ antiporter MnhB subunit [Natronocella acetinitrilica]|uniref:Multisubunit Na+/H+ antiporter MnhB subunit n=1 Tax=Natronocella acetinitrilica TaxID=414046 RepID=A0AAE3G334_9GAMM|nr:hydrogenase subunit MbhD domain-containing protein [Natronocella acetinitrilica]MCP1674911.1 multisubunit Na+/H+ antiporter MnhB subunit [Natronocella acetinitrilica]
MTLLDTLLAVMITLLALQCVTARGLFAAIVGFIVMGLVLALSWARLDAPDLALAEAAIGAGLLGVLLLSTWRYLRAHGDDDTQTPPTSPLVRWLAAAGSLTFGLGAAWALTGLVPGDDSAGALALDSLDAAGVEQPVTAVLLNFRAYDTLLEMGVLLMALIGAVLARSPLFEHAPDEKDEHGSPLTTTLATVYAPMLLLVGAYLVWAGAYMPGGAFQGGAVLAGAGVMLVLCGRLAGAPDGTLALRSVLTLGVLVFIAIGLALMPWQGTFMTYPAGFVTPIMLIIEFSLAASIAVSLLLLFTGTNALRQGEAR